MSQARRAVDTRPDCRNNERDWLWRGRPWGPWSSSLGLFEVGSAAGLSDRQLLERYNAGGRDPAGEAAFAALVGRHGPMVLARISHR